MSGVTLTAATRSNLLAAQDTAALLATTQQRLATGKKVNSALDNAVSFFTAQGLDNRATALTSILDGISNGIQTIKAASQGITSIKKLTDQLNSTAQQALAATVGYTSKAAIGSTGIPNITAANILGGTAVAATVAGSAVNNVQTPTAAPITAATTLTGGTNTDSLGTSIASGDTLIVNGTTLTFVNGTAGVNQISLSGTVQDVLDAVDNVTGSATPASITAGAISFGTGTASDLTLGGTALTALGLTAGTTARTYAPGTQLTGPLSVTVGTGTNAQTKTVTFGTASGQISTLAALNDALESIGASAIVSTGGTLSITTTNESGAEDVSLAGAAAASFSAATASASLGGTGKTARDNLVADYNKLLTQIDQLAADSGFQGVNLLAGDNLKVQFNADNTSSLTVKGSATTSSSLGLNGLTSADFVDNVSISRVQVAITAAQSSLQTTASSYGSNLSVVQNRQDFSKNLINILQEGAGNLTNADLNEEAANSQALSTRQSLAISALSLANTAQQQVLQLLR
jgi:flagellin-like hook-associated protein FlgL